MFILSLLNLQLAVRHELFTLETKVSLPTHKMEFEYGKIESFEEFEKPFITLYISQNIAYDTKIRKFNVFNIEYLKKQMGKGLQKGTSVKFSTIKSGEFYNLNTIEESEMSECFGCGAYTPQRNNQQMECEKCYGSPKKLKIDKELKIVKKRIAQYKYSQGITLTFIDETEQCLINHLYISNTFENNIMYNKLVNLKIGDKIQIRGWIQEENDHSSLVNIVAIDVCQESS